MIPTLTTIPLYGPVGGVALIGKLLYIVKYGSKELDVYDSTRFAFKRKLPVSGAESLWCIAACPTYMCLYVTDHVASTVHRVSETQPHCVHK